MSFSLVPEGNERLTGGYRKRKLRTFECALLLVWFDRRMKERIVDSDAAIISQTPIT